MSGDTGLNTPKQDLSGKASGLPEWAAELRRRYLSGEATLFLLYGNVHDLAAAPGKTDRFVSLREFLHRFLARTRDIIAFFNHSEGLKFAAPEMRDQFIRAINAGRMHRHKPDVELPLPRDARRVLPLLEEYMVLPDTRGALVFDFVETVVPEGNIGFMSSDDRANLVTLQRWASDPLLLRSDNLVILVAENLSDVHRQVVTNPQLSAIQIPLPTEEERGQFLGYLARKYQQTAPEKLASLSAGLTRVQMEGIYRQAWESKVEVSVDLVRARKKAIIEQECFGLVAFIEPEHDFSKVGGMEEIKRALGRAVAAIHKGQTPRVPMGMLFVGPMGTGKTYVAEAFAAECRLTCLRLKNFRGSLVGATEANLEKIISVVKAMGYVVFIIDEADRSLSGSGGEHEGGTESRVIARLKEFMSDTSNRGRIVFLIMTNRPDKLDADMKRSGRLDLKIPFFFPQSSEEREGIFQALLRKNRIGHNIKDFAQAVAATDGYSGAEIEAILLLALGFTMDDSRETVEERDLLRAVEDFIPSRDMAMIDYMELLAVFECSSRSMLPAKYREMSTEALNERLREMRRHLL